MGAGMSTCDHRWVRLPVVDFSVTYRCDRCKTGVQAGWMRMAGCGMEDIDRAFEAEYGGKVAAVMDGRGHVTPAPQTPGLSGP
jgi:hypothetical protein